MKRTILALCCAAIGAVATHATVSRGADAAPPRLDAYPPDVQLTTSRDRQSFIVMLTRPDGVTEDVTATAKTTLANPALARIEGHTLVPTADGTTTLAIEYQGQNVSLPVTVKDATVERPISFKLDVMPVFMRAGCNTGSCHGAARGKDGFNLSLFGYDPDGDYNRITHEIGFRRINLALPAESLLLEKACGAVPHTGGKRFANDTDYYRTVLRWLEGAVPKDAPEVATVTALELFPPKAVLEGKDTTQQFVARAKYSDGTDRDVTNLVVFLTNNDNSSPINPDGLLTAAARGEAFIMARFATYTVGSQVLVLPKGLDYTAPTNPPTNYVDELVNAKLQKIRVLPSDLCTDEIFLRRVTIDITGVLPTADEYQAFVADADPAKRAKLIDRLLERKEFSEIWALKWANLLMVKSSNEVSYKSMFLYSNWLTNQISSNVPLNQMVQNLLSATGGTFKSPATNYYQIERDTLKTAENVAEVFMGIRTQCAQCHNHPFDRWTMDDYYGFAAFFAQIGRKQGEDYRETIIFNSGGGEVNHPVGARRMAPKFLGGATPDVTGKDRREVLVKWLASPENPYFATSVANRVWAHFFGLGIVEPVDDVRVSNPASNPELFESLGAKLTSYNYDFKQLVRDIANSQTYQRLVAGQCQQRGRREEFLAQPDSPHPGRKPAGLPQPGGRSAGEVSGPAAGRARRTNRRRPDEQLLFDLFWSFAATDRLRLRGNHGAHALSSPASDQRRHRGQKNRRDQALSKNARRRPKAVASRRVDLYHVPLAQTESRRDAKTGDDFRHRGECPQCGRRHPVGRVELARILVQSLRLAAPI